MPIETDEILKSLLTEGRITGVTVDTNLFDGQRLNLKSATLRAISSLKDRPFRFILSSTVVREVQGHLTKAMEDALRSVRKAVGDAVFLYDISKPTRDDFVSQITGGNKPAEAARDRMNDFVRDSACEIIDDTLLVDIASVFESYFDRSPPFSHGKKAEFPDALALHALEKVAAKGATGILVISSDGDWKSFCEKSPNLYWVNKIEAALSLINAAPVGLRNAIYTWITDGQDGRENITQEVSNLIENMFITVDVNSNYGEVEAQPWAPEVLSIDWPDESDIDFLEIEEISSGHYKILISLPISIQIQYNIELDFSIWDSVDKESIGMGGRMIEVRREEEVRANVTVDISEIRSKGKAIELIDVELDISALRVNLGDVTVFEEDDFDK